MESVSLKEEAGGLALSLSAPHNVRIIVRRQPSANHEADSHQTPDLPALDLGLPNPKNYEK